MIEKDEIVEKIEQVKCLGNDKKKSSLYLRVRRLLATIISIFIIIAVSIPLIFTIFPLLSQKYWPVIDDISYKIERHGRIVNFQPIIIKHRECRIVDMSWYLMRKSVIVNAVIPIDVVNVPKNDSVRGDATFPAGTYELGPFQFMIPRSFDYLGKAHLIIGSILYYDCNMPWYSRSELGPYDIPISDTLFGIIPGLEINEIAPPRYR